MHDWAALLGAWPEKFPLGFNIAPTQFIPVYTGMHAAESMRWSLIPIWSREISSKYATFNARLESVEEKPAFKHAWENSQRCLIPALGYYEWRLEQGAKQPYFVRLPDELPMVLAGLFEPARNAEFPASCTVLTQAAQGSIRELHNRVPVLLPVTIAETWFAATPDKAMQLIEDNALQTMLTYFPVSRRVSNARNEGEDLVNPIAGPVSPT
jgi:putative SOS response-associated peptidase YedK